MAISDLKYSDITQKIIGCAFNVHNKLGTSFMEIIYQRALAIEMEKAGLHFGREVEVPIFYDGEEIGIRRVDFIVEECVVVEIKATTELNDTHLAQSINYLHAIHYETGLLINFGGASVKFKRIINSGKTESQQNLNHGFGIK